MTSWAIIAVVAGAGAGLGATLDRMMLRRQKVVLHERMIAWWLSLADQRRSQLPERAAKAVRDSLRTTWTWVRSQPWPGALAVVLASWLATSIAFTIGYRFETWGRSLRDPSGLALPGWPLYVANAPLDFLTLGVTYYALGHVVSSRPVRSVVVVIADFAVASAFTVVTLAVLLATNTTLAGVPGTYLGSADPFGEASLSIGSVIVMGPEAADTLDGPVLSYSPRKEPIVLLRVAADAVWRGMGLRFSGKRLEGVPVEHVVEEVVSGEEEYEAFRQAYSDGVGSEPTNMLFPVTATLHQLLMAATSLLPTVAFLSWLTILLVAGLVLNSSRWLMMHTLERATEDDPEVDPARFLPWTLAGAVLGVLALVTNALLEIWRLLA